MSICYSQQIDSTFYFFDKATPSENVLEKIEFVNKPYIKNYYRLIYYSKLREKDSMIAYLDYLEKSKKTHKFFMSLFLFKIIFKI